MPVANAQEVEINIVGSSKFGRYNKISDEKTYNMFISDGWLINYAGYKKIQTLGTGNEGRGIFVSTRSNIIIAVVGQAVIRMTTNLQPQFIGSLKTTTGEVSIDENLNGQICITDGTDAYIYSEVTNLFTEQNITASNNALVPNYVEYHNTFFLIGNNVQDNNRSKWFVYRYLTDDTIEQDPIGGEQALENKPDSAVAVVRLPGKGNNVIAFGRTVAAIYTQVGGALNYQRLSSSNIDYGVVNTNTIAKSDEIICWLAQNENNAPVIMYTTGGSPERISTDGIDALLARVKNPEQSTGLFYRVDGHLFYQLTFYGQDDNFTLSYDFNTQQFFNLCDENFNYNPIRQIVYFNNKLLGLSIRDGNLYEISTDITTFNYGEDDQMIPRIRICKAIRYTNGEKFRIGKVSIWVEQGVDPNYTGINALEACSDYLVTEDVGDLIITEDGDFIIGEAGSCVVYRPRIDTSMSKNGGISFTNIVGKPLNIYGEHINQLELTRLGKANEVIFQFRFYTLARAVMSNGTAEITK